MDCTLAPVFEGSYEGRKQWKNLDRLLCNFYFRFFSCVIWGNVPNFNIIPLPFAKKNTSLLLVGWSALLDAGAC